MRNIKFIISETGEAVIGKLGNKNVYRAYLTGTTWSTNTELRIPYANIILKSEIWVKLEDSNSSVKVDGYFDSTQYGRIALVNQGLASATLLLQYTSRYANQPFVGVIEYTKNE